MPLVTPNNMSALPIKSTLLLAILMAAFANHPALASTASTQCSRTADYAIFFSGLHTGKMARTETWHGSSATITSNSKASILGIHTQYRQQAELTWSNTQSAWLTQQFHQQVSGFRTRDMRVTLNKSGFESRVDLDGKVTAYTSTQIPLRDVDTLAIQIRELLLQEQREFTLIRQASDGIESYQYQVQAPITATMAPWGTLQLIPIEQEGDEDITYYFAPSIDYQLVKARYHGIILQGAIELTHYTTTCAPVKPFTG